MSDWAQKHTWLGLGKDHVSPQSLLEKHPVLSPQTQLEEIPYFSTEAVWFRLAY